MATARRKQLRHDNRGAVILEFAVVGGLLITVLFGVIEYMHLFSQWNAATKAVQAGARLAATSDPVWSPISNLTGLENGLVPGAALTTANYDYKVTCSGDTASCNLDTPPPNGAPDTYSEDAMDLLVYGRRFLQGVDQCGDLTVSYFGMCDVFRRVRPENVRITYQHTNAGYASRPGGLVPTITVELIDLNFEFIFLDDLLNLDPIPIPGLRSTMIAEDMRSAAPTF